MRHKIGGLCILALTCLPSCTLLGLGTGATIDAISAPHYGEPKALPLTRGERIRAVTQAGNRVEGFYAGVRPPSACDPEARLLVRQENGVVVPLPYSDVRGIGVEHSGKGWLYGTLIGLALDLTAIVVFAVAQPDWGSCLGCSANSLTLQ